MTLAWQHPFTCMIAGATMSGKTVFVSRFLQNLDSMVDTKISEIIWFHGASQPLHEELKSTLKVPIRFVKGLEDIEDIAPEASPPPRLIVLDDLMREATGSVMDVFSKGSHHSNISVIFLTQNLFHKGKYTRDISLNSHYIVVFKNPREKSQIFSFARQIFPENPRFIQEAYADATQNPHSYLLFDLKQTTPEAFRFRTSIFPGEQSSAYILKKRSREVSELIV